MRVVSLLPGATDTLVTLGGAPLLVGVSHSCDHPAVAGLPRVTATPVDASASSAAIDAAVREISAAGRPMYSLDHERIRALRPDLLVTQSLCDVCAVSESEVRRLAASLDPPPRVLTLGGGTVDALLDDVLTLGRATGLADEAEELVAGLRRRIRSVHERLKAARAPRPRVAVLEWTDPLFASGHWVPEQVRLAGGTDVLAAPGEHSRVLTHHQLLDAAPQLVVVAPCGFGLDRAADEAARLLRALPSLGARQVWALDAATLTSRPGPRVVAGIEALARLFAPALFTPLATDAARRVA
ncbi:MAG: ABC transporter substrate-binding protein [Gemmatimonadota bacterium]|nr:ABC transporter substrate-binding protein [Gemmatimonadota bacterium]